MAPTPVLSPRKTRQRLTRRYVTALAILALAVTVSEVAVQGGLARLSGDSTEINLAGRQRMRSQRIAVSVLSGDAERAQAEVRAWADMHRALLDGDPRRGLSGVAPGPARAALQALTDEVAAVDAAVGEYIAARAVGDARGADQAEVEVVEGARVFLAGMERVVFALDAQSAATLRMLRGLALGIWVLLLGLSVVLARRVFRPAVDRVVETVEQAVTQSQLLQTVANTIPHHIYVKDRAGRAVLRNTASAAALGFDDPLDTVGLTDAEVSDGADGGLSGQAALNDDLTVVETGVSIVDKEEPDGAGGWLLTTKVPYRDAKGEVIGLVGVSRDITEWRETQLALARAGQAAEAGALAKETFLANVSHEMRTPLHAVLGLSRLLAAGPVSASQADLVTGISRAADALLALIDDLLDRARLNTGHATFHDAPFFLADVLDDVQRMLGPIAAAKGVAVEVAGPDGVDTLLGDAKRLRQILLNLGGNAVKFTEAGWVRVSAAVERREPDVVYLRFEVEDTGIGIPADQQARIFEAFAQATEHAARAHGGTGLGLSIVRDLVERQGGTVSVESVEGAGSRFLVRMPFRLASVDEVGDPAAPAAGSDGPDLAGLHALIVEDNPTNRFIARHQVQAWGMAVSEAASGQEALDWLAAGGAADVVLMDLQMPGMDGIEATRRIRAAGHTALPVVALTASALASRRGATLEAGFSDFVLKPFDPADLRRRLCLLLGRAAPTAADTAAIDRERLRTSAVGDPEMERVLVAMFLDEVMQAAPRLLAAAAAGDRPGLRAEAHALKGQAAYVGATVLVGALARLEADAAQPDGPRLSTEATAQATAALADAVWALRVLHPTASNTPLP